MDEAVKAAFEKLEPKVRDTLQDVRELILRTAEEVDAAPLTETLKWGEPAYLTEATKSGTTIRLGTPKGERSKCAMFVSCQTTLVEEFREIVDDPAIRFEGNRAIVFTADEPLPTAALEHCIARALTYKRKC